MKLWIILILDNLAMVNGYLRSERQDIAVMNMEMMNNEKSNGIKELIKDVSTWGDGGILEMEVLEETSNTYFFNVHKCPYYEKYKELGLTELGVGFSCCRDKPFALGFNSKLKLIRTKTIMEGSDFCDFRYFLEPE